MRTRTMLWRRLDVPGHDACRLAIERDGCSLAGTAVFREGRAVARLDYAVECDAGWRTRRGHVRGWIGARMVDVRIERSERGVWTLDGRVVRHLDECFDLDLGFTPATNVLQLRRVGLRVGERAEVPVAWFDASSRGIELVRQTYVRRAPRAYAYESPRFGHAALLRVDAAGFVTSYPRLWREETR